MAASWVSSGWSGHSASSSVSRARTPRTGPCRRTASSTTAPCKSIAASARRYMLCEKGALRVLHPAARV